MGLFYSNGEFTGIPYGKIIISKLYLQCCISGIFVGAS